ncbi:MAG: Hsp70 family protein, partial [Eggerthellaceae bacterium]|nr:Hsp70 family protein [Eggerthellaceae bacterium]
VITTAAAYQTKVEVRVLQGERPMAKDNKLIGTFQLKGIKRAPAGVPQINVSFDIDTNGILTVSAKDLGTGNEQSITITDSERMSDEEIEAAIADAKKYAAEDQKRRDTFAIREEAEHTTNEAESLLNEKNKTLDKDTKKQVKAQINDVRKILMKKTEKMTDTDRTDLKGATERLTESVKKLKE